ncbi:MAG: 2,4-diaminopentanoate dehydrogenase [Candidatus Ozemobacteraceae bacterium]
MKRIRVVQWGLGAMGSGMVKLMLEKPGLQVVGAIDSRKDYIGKDLGDALELGEKLNVKITDTPKSVLKKSDVDIVILATSSFTREVIDTLQVIAEAGIDCITIAEEMALPEASEPDLAKTIDELAKRHDVTILGTGINPGFVLDSLIINLSGVCHNVERIEASRINDLSCFGPTVMRTQGVGTTPEEFKAGLGNGSIVGHIGFKESITMISLALGLGVDKIEEVREPIISNTDRETKYVKIKAGMVAGCRHIGIGFANGKEVVKLIHPQQIRPEAENVDTGDYITIFGTPEIKMSIKPEVPGGIGTIGVAVNMIPLVRRATAGIKRMIDLPVPACLMGPEAYIRRM